jgi:hypothetical protein
MMRQRAASAAAWKHRVRATAKKRLKPLAGRHRETRGNVQPRRLWYAGPNAISYAKFYSRSHDAVIRVYDATDNGIETHEHAGGFKEP